MRALMLLTLCYAVIARASLMLAFAHTNVTPVWPPSGIAFAALLLMGYRAWPACLPVHCWPTSPPSTPMASL
jgi:integral membrane sensor domain MASE1